VGAHVEGGGLRVAELVDGTMLTGTIEGVEPKSRTHMRLADGSPWRLWAVGRAFRQIRQTPLAEVLSSSTSSQQKICTGFLH
jgi:hypothetical protein